MSRYSEEQVQKDVAAVKAAGAEFVIAFNHWGTENTHAVNALQEEHAQQMTDAGVDFIICSHPHCLQPARILTAKDGRHVGCIFSMGNFVSSMAKDINNDTAILRLDLSRSNDGVGLERAAHISCLL